MPESLESAVLDFLERRRADLLAEWEHEIRRLPKASSLSRPVLLDHIPVLLDEMADALRGAAADVPAGSGHADERLGAGFDLAEVVAEYGTLRGVLVRGFARERLSPPTAHLELVHRLIDEAIGRAVVLYTSAARRAVEAIDQVAGALLERERLPALLQRLLQALIGAVPAVEGAAILVREGPALRVHATEGLVLPAIIAEDNADESRGAAEAIRASGFPHVWSDPLVHDDQVIGRAYAASRTAPALLADQQTVFRSMATRAADLVAQSRTLVRERATNITTRALSTAESLDDAVVTLLATIGSSFGWDIGTFWTREPDEQVLRCAHVWFAENVEAPRFEAVTRDLALAPGVGLPWRAWQSGAVVWSDDLDAEPAFPRLAAAIDDGLRSAVVLPVLDGKRVIGIFELFSRTRRARTDEAVEMTEAIAHHLPEFLRRIAAQDRVRRSEAELTAILHAALDAVISMDASGRVTRWNPAAEEMFGYPAADALGRELGNLIIPLHLRDAHRRGLARYLTTGEERYFNRRLELMGVTRDGVEFPVELIITRAGAIPPLFTGYVRNISERVRKDAERERLVQHAQEATRAREQILAIVSHDLKNPLSAITMGAALLLKRGGAGLSETMVRRAAEAILRSVDRMDRLITDLLDVASLRAGQFAVERRVERVDTMFEEAVDLHRGHASERGIELSSQIDPSVPECCVDVDRHRILQVLSNLIGNAVKFCSPGASIDIRAWRKANEIQIAVADTGPGIPGDELPHLFEPYWTGVHDRKLGTGLGLFISKGIVEAHGGKLWVDSVVGRGSTFIFSVPLMVEAEV